MSQPKIPSGYWLSHVILVIGLPLILLLAYIGVFAKIELFTWFYFILIWPVIGAGLAAIYGYHKEANQLKKVEADWIPHRWLYTIAHILVGGWPIAAIYLVQRWRHIGLPWSDLPYIGS